MHVLMQTTKGDIVLALDQDKAPISVANFLQYVDDGHYDGTIFHRVIAHFMIQGGGFTADMRQKSTRAPIKNEWKNGLKNTRGTVSMARTRIADSATCQFFINVVDNGFLDQPNDGAAYAVFGTVPVLRMFRRRPSPSPRPAAFPPTRPPSSRRKGRRTQVV